MNEKEFPLLEKISNDKYAAEGRGIEPANEAHVTLDDWKKIGKELRSFCDHLTMASTSNPFHGKRMESGYVQMAQWDGVFICISHPDYIELLTSPIEELKP